MVYLLFFFTYRGLHFLPVHCMLGRQRGQVKVDLKPPNKTQDKVERRMKCLD